MAAFSMAERTRVKGGMDRQGGVGLEQERPQGVQVVDAVGEGVPGCVSDLESRAPTSVTSERASRFNLRCPSFAR